MSFLTKATPVLMRGAAALALAAAALTVSAADGVA